MKNLIFIIPLFSLIAACSAPNQGRVVKAPDKNKEKHEVASHQIDNPQSLKDFLIRVPGVVANPNSVYIRGNSREPLFILDGIRIGRSYRKARSAIDVNNIASVEVLKGPGETAIYGLDGQYGVILIKSKQ